MAERAQIVAPRALPTSMFSCVTKPPSTRYSSGVRPVRVRGGVVTGDSQVMLSPVESGAGLTYAFEPEVRGFGSSCAPDV